MLSHLSHVRLCEPMDWSLPGSSVQRILWARTLEWVAGPSSRGSSQPRDGGCGSCIAGGFIPAEPLGSLVRACVLCHFTCLQLFCKPLDCSLLGYSAHEISQARILKWVVTPSSRGSSLPRGRTHISDVS